MNIEQFFNKSTTSNKISVSRVSVPTNKDKNNDKEQAKDEILESCAKLNNLTVENNKNPSDNNNNTSSDLELEKITLPPRFIIQETGLNRFSFNPLYLSQILKCSIEKFQFYNLKGEEITTNDKSSNYKKILQNYLKTLKFTTKTDRRRRLIHIHDSYMSHISRNYLNFNISNRIW